MEKGRGLGLFTLLDLLMIELWQKGNRWSDVQ